MSPLASHPTDHVTTLDQGAQVMQWHPSPVQWVGIHGAGDPGAPATHPVLWTSALSRFESGVAVRGGIPLCLPWFGGGPSGDLSPKHGTARTTVWEKLDGDHHYRLRGEPTDAFPHAWEAEFVAVGDADKLELRLTVTNPTDEAYVIEELAHTYLAVSDVRRVRVLGLEGVAYEDRVPGAEPRHGVQKGPITFAAETDRIFAGGGPLVLEDPDWDRALTITTVGAGSTVVWNPWIAKAAAMEDFGDDEWTGMLCLESGNVTTDANGAAGALRLEAGASHTLDVTIQIGSLAAAG